MSLTRSKTDPAMGLEIHNHLVVCGVETPIIQNDLSDKEKIDIIEPMIRTIMETLGLDLSDDSLSDTPKRVAKMYVSEIYWGLDYSAFPKGTTIENKINYDEMVTVRNINVQSNCEHHLIVIDGTATVAYIPNGKVLGLSKLNRIVEYFSKRPQIQERLTEQVYHALQYLLGTDDIAVVIDAVHYCVKSRGVEDAGSSTVTSKLGGCFKTDSIVRTEFMNTVNKI
jgi:GTP cyclohydrolase IA